MRTDLAGLRRRARGAARAQPRATRRPGSRTPNLAASRYAEILARTAPTEFLGYETTTADGRVVAILRDGIEYETLEAVAEVELRAEAAARAEIVLDRTPFYAESGGQVADTGVLRDGRRDRRCSRSTTSSASPAPRPRASPSTAACSTARSRVGDVLRAEVDAERRAHTMRNHTGTHLLHRALRNVVGERARQAGSLVTPDYLRFDFPFDRGLTDDEKRAIEREVRRVVRDDRPVSVEWMTMAEAQDAGADAFFDEKYGERVRTIRVEGFSHELCGGTHCRASGQIGNFIITGERSIGSGMRRIEAVTGRRGGPPDGGALRAARAGRRRGGRAGPGGRRGADRRAPGRAARDEAPPQGRRRGRRPARGPGTSPRRRRTIAPGVAFVGAVLDLESIDALKGFAKDVRGVLARAASSRVGLDADEPQLFVTVSDDLVARGIAAGPLVQARRAAASTAAAAAAPRWPRARARAARGSGTRSRPCAPRPPTAPRARDARRRSRRAAAA